MSLTTLETGVGAPSDPTWTGNPNDDANIIETLKALALKPVPSAPPTFPLEFASIAFSSLTDYFINKDRTTSATTLSPTFTLNDTGADLTVSVPSKSLYLCFIPLDSGNWKIEFGAASGSSALSVTVPNRAYYATPSPESSLSSYTIGEFVFFDSNNTVVFICQGWTGSSSTVLYGSTVVNCNPYTLFA